LHVNLGRSYTPRRAKFDGSHGLCGRNQPLEGGEHGSRRAGGPVPPLALPHGGRTRLLFSASSLLASFQAILDNIVPFSLFSSMVWSLAAREEAESTLLSAFADLAPTTCALDLIGGLHIALNRPSYSEWKISSMVTGVGAPLQHQALLWALAARSPGQRESIINTPCLCSAAHRHTVIHRCGYSVVHNQPDHRSTLPGSVLLHLCLVESHRLLADMVYKFASIAPRIERLPSIENTAFMSGILPLGAEGTLRGLAQWATCRLDASLQIVICDCLAAIISVYHPLVGTYALATSSIFHHCIIDGITTCWREMNTKYGRHNYMATARHLISMSFLSARLIEQLANEEQRQFFIGHSARSLLESCVTAAEIMDGLDTHLSLGEKMQIRDRLMTTLHTINDLSDFLFCEFPAVHGMKTQHHVQNALPAALQRIEQPHASLWSRLLRTLGWLDINQRCMAPGCPRTVCDHPPRRFQVCGGCMRMRYCSVTCQKQAWDGTVPQRSICRRIWSVPALQDPSLRWWQRLASRYSVHSRRRVVV
jgi:hypothetical protein